VWGNSSCAKLKSAVHCRNCDVFSSAASRLLDAEVPPGCIDAWTSHYASEKEKSDPTAISLVIFRLGPEWFALKSGVLQEITELRPVHSVPHTSSIALGVTNVRGALLIAIALAEILGLDPVAFQKNRSPFGMTAADARPERVLVASHQCKPLAFPVSEVGGIQKISLSQLKTPPVTVSQARDAFSRHAFEWNGKTAGLLDEELLFYSIQKRLS
jgi:chemotaxis-related protein WspD